MAASRGSPSLLSGRCAAGGSSRIQRSEMVSRRRDNPAGHVYTVAPQSFAGSIMAGRLWRALSPLALLGAFAPGLAQAHAVLERKEAPAGSYYKAVIMIGHGCQGSATRKLRVRIPAGVHIVKPQPKPGWELAVRRDKLDPPVDNGHGGKVTEGVVEVAWSGALADEHFDEFVMQVRLPDQPGATLYFPVVQECDTGVNRWIDVPAAGRPNSELREPAPALKLLPKGASH